MMEEENPKDFFRSTKISNSFKIVLALIVFAVVGVIAKSIHDQGGEWETLVLGTLFCVPLLVWFLPTLFRLTQNPGDLPEAEKKGLASLQGDPLTKIFDLKLLEIFVVAGYVTKWLFFYVFLFGAITIAVQGQTMLNVLLVGCLSLIWCPWVEKFLGENPRTIFIFLGRATFTCVVMGLGALLT